MTGLWLVSYLILWVLVIALGLLLIGALRQIGLMQAQSARTPDAAGSAVPLPEDDGPPLGSRLHDVVAESVNGFGRVDLRALAAGGQTVLMFMSPMCESCQHVADPLNALVDDAARRVHPVVIMRADGSACQAFNSVFPLRVPLICDENRGITMEFEVHSAPYALLYDAQGTLRSKGKVTAQKHLLALLDEASRPAPELAPLSSPATPSGVVG